MPQTTSTRAGEPCFESCSSVGTLRAYKVGSMARKLTKTVVAERRRVKVAALYCKGYAIHRIAEVIGGGIHPSTIGKDLMAIRKDWQARAAESYQARLDRELAKIDLVETECWDAWEKSKEPGEISETEIANDGKKDSADRKTVSRRIEQRLPEPRYMDKITWCIEQRCKLLSLYKGPQLPGGGEGQGFIQITQTVIASLPGMTPEQLQTLAAVQRMLGPVPEDAAKGIVDGSVSDDRPEASSGPEPA